MSAHRSLEPLRRMFWPRSVAVVGASPNLAAIGGQALDVLLHNGYRGSVIPVNPKYGEISGLTTAPSISAIEEPIDLAIVAVPAGVAVDVVAQCADAEVGNIVLFSSGFAEVGASGARSERQVFELASAAGMRVLGPNCQGFYNVQGSVAATFSPAADPRRGLQRVVSGNVAVLSQSGALGFAVFGAGANRGLGFSIVVSTGNGVDVDVLDVLELLIEDDRTEVVLTVLEGFDDGSRFRELAARAVHCGTQIVVSKLGRSKAGSRAAVTHTAHLAGSSTAYDAVFDRHGVIQVEDLDELIDAGFAFSRAAPAGPRIGVISTSGGAGVWLADACDRLGLELPEVGEELANRLSDLIAGGVRIDNPLDLTGRVVRDANVAATVRAFMDDQAYDSVVLATSLSDPLILEREAVGFVGLGAPTNPKPLVVLTYTEPSRASIGLLTDLELPWSTSPARVARMLRHLDASRRPSPRDPGPSQRPGPKASSLATLNAHLLSEPECKSMLRAWAIPVPDGAVVSTADEAAQLGMRLDGPLAMKLVASGVSHKSDVGGVVLGVAPARAETVFRELLERGNRSMGIDAIDGVLVERMAPPGHEVIVGVLHDQTFGPIVMVGSGGVHAEMLGDSIFLPLPIDHAEASRALERLRSAPVLNGARGEPPSDIPALADLIVRIASMAASGDIDELDLNPVIVHEAGHGVTVVDASAVLRPDRTTREVDDLQSRP